MTAIYHALLVAVFLLGAIFSMLVWIGWLLSSMRAEWRVRR